MFDTSAQISELDVGPSSFNQPHYFQTPSQSPELPPLCKPLYFSKSLHQLNSSSHDSLTEDEPASLLLERGCVGNFGEVLLGSKDDFLVPITLDLGELRFEATGIVCGVAGKLCGGDLSGGTETGFWNGEEVAGEGGMEGKIEMSYLSTARAGTVVVNEVDLERAMRVLRINGGG